MIRIRKYRVQVSDWKLDTLTKFRCFPQLLQAMWRSNEFKKVSSPISIKGRSKQVKQSHYAQWNRLGGEEDSSYSFLTSALDGVSGHGHAPAALYLREKDPRYPLDWRLGGSQSLFEHRGYRKNPLSLQGIEPLSPGCPVRS
jgi:hypothetical protein